MDYRFSPGQRVWKPQGYSFPGIVQAAFTNSMGAERYVVEMTSEVTGNPTGLLHIFAPEQLENDERFDLQGVLIKPMRGAYTQEMSDQFTAEQSKGPVGRVLP